MFEPPFSCIVCQRNHATIFNAQTMAKKETTNQQTIWRFLISLARGRRSTKVREASDVNNASSSSIVGDEVHVNFVASNQTHSVQSIIPKCSLTFAHMYI